MQRTGPRKFHEHKHVDQSSTLNNICESLGDIHCLDQGLGLRLWAEECAIHARISREMRPQPDNRMQPADLKRIEYTV